MKRTRARRTCSLWPCDPEPQRPPFTFSSEVLSLYFIFICMPAAVAAGAALDFARPVRLLELCVLAEAIVFLGVLAAEEVAGTT